MKLRKKNVVAVLAGVAVATAVAASAASLGGLTTQWLGANSNVVQSPVTGGLDVDWDTAYDAALGYYVVSGFTLDTTDAKETLPEGADVQLTLELAEGTTEFEGTIDAEGTVDFGAAALPSIAAHDVEGVSVVLVGGGSATGTDLP
ncbi:hypothetical protein [Pseudactinotalea suaedae]|uniref:hypothetical protein n=1 Tax=Pseudactinotalea suaedae TaxID=1524924 RepID=UPI0012E14DA4|nr:hypothetical protein [Pseudactinotalea suaedae]